MNGSTRKREPMQSNGLPLDVAGKLCAALSSSVAASGGLRALVVKGLVTSHYGLRDERVSADVDVLLPPGDAERFIDALKRAGWRERPMSEGADALAAHSHELIHDDWPCDIDVHHRFPGLLAEPLEGFDALWDRHTLLPLAGVDVVIPDRDGAIIITALHALRHVDTDANHGEELRRIGVALASMSEHERDSIRALAAATGAEGPLAELFAAHGIDVKVEPSSALEDWTTRRLAGDAYAGNVVASVGSAPWRQRPRLLWLAAWPSAVDMRATHPEIGDGATALMRARLARIGRGARQLPAALRARRVARSNGHRGARRGE